MSLRDTILAAQDLPSERVEIPEWGISLNVRTLTGTERDAFEQSIVEGKQTNLANIRAKLVVRCTTDDTGARVFTDADADALGTKSGKALDRLFAVAQRLSGLGKEDVEELAKNSGSVTSDASISS